MSESRRPVQPTPAMVASQARPAVLCGLELLLALLMALPPRSSTLIFAPRQLGLWDQSGRLAPDGSWRMWYDAQNGSARDIGFGLATSDDGLLWRDEGLTMRPFDEPSLGSGAVWQSPTDPEEWVINYSDSCSDANCSGQQIRFQTSRNSSLRGPWLPRRDIPPYVPNVSLGYGTFRWDTINPYYDEKSETLYGWWTAGLPTDGPGPPSSRSSPRLAGQSAMGFGKSSDGIHWQTLTPAILTWPKGTAVTAAGFEIGGVAPIESGGKRRWYASVCCSHQELPAAIGGRVGCFTFVSDEPGGPYTLAQTNSAMIGSSQHGHDPEYVYYHRFFQGPGGVLLTHYQQYDKAHWKREPGTHCYMSALKRLAVDPADGTLRMTWWDENEALKLSPGAKYRPATTVIWLGAIRGTILEGKVIWGAVGGLCLLYGSGGAPEPRAGTNFVATYVGFNRTHVVLGEAATTDCESTATNDTLGVTDTALEPTRGLHLRAGVAVLFRLMFRRGMYDIYLDDSLIQSYALPAGGVPYKIQQVLRLVGSWTVSAALCTRALVDRQPTAIDTIAGKHRVLQDATELQSWSLGLSEDSPVT